MSTRDNNRRSKRSLSASVAVGLILVPLSAFAASLLVDRTTDAEPVEDMVDAPAAAPVESAARPSVPTVDDLVTACGEAGLEMVATEADGTITAIQQAALDALRPICADHGLALPGKPVPPPVSQTVVLTELQPLPEPPASAGTSVRTDDDDDQDRDDDDHDRDDDDEGEDDDHDGDED